LPVDLSAVRQDDVEIAGADGRNWAAFSRWSNASSLRGRARRTFWRVAMNGQQALRRL